MELNDVELFSELTRELVQAMPNAIDLERIDA